MRAFETSSFLGLGWPTFGVNERARQNCNLGPVQAVRAIEKGKSRKPWKRRTDKYMRPFLLDVYISARHVNAKVVHRVTSKVIAVATTSSKDLRKSLPALNGLGACEAIGQLIAERAKEADVYAVAYEPRDIPRLQEKLDTVLHAVAQNGVAVLS